MNRLGITGLAALVFLSQPPMQAQVRTTIPKVQTRQAQRDVEFLRLYDDVKTLEAKLQNEPPETEHRHHIKTYFEDGKAEEVVEELGPPSVSDKIGEMLHDKINKFVSRYGFSFDKYENKIFTSGENLVVKNYEYNPHPWRQYIIFSELSAISCKISGIDVKIENRSYKYQVLESVPVKLGFDIIRHPEITDGYIPLFDSFDFDGISRKIRHLDLDLDKSLKYLKDENGNVYPAVDERFSFSSDQLENIGIMLLRMIEDSPDIADLPIPKRDMFIPSPRVAGNRIVMGARADSRKIYHHGNLSLSIAPNGSVNYFFQLTDVAAFVLENLPPIYRTLRIDFQRFSK